MTLWSKGGASPQALPERDFAADAIWTDLANSPEGRAATGWVQAPDKPAAQPGKVVIWRKGVWVQVEAPAGSTAEPITIVSRMQLRRQMLRMPRTDSSPGTLLEQVDAVVDAQAASGTVMALDLKEYWTQTSNFHLDHPVLIAFAASQGIGADALAAAFQAAALLT